MKRLYSFRCDIDLLERAQKVANRKKTTVSALITQSLLALIEEDEMIEERKIWDFRYNQTRRRKVLSHHLREKIRRKYNFTCQQCGITEKEWQEQNPEWYNVPKEYRLHVAHIEAQANFTDPAEANKEENLTLLCPKCHRENHRIQKMYLCYNKL